MTESDKRVPRKYAIIGAAMEVHRQLGGGFLEAVKAVLTQEMVYPAIEWMRPRPRRLAGRDPEHFLRLPPPPPHRHRNPP